MLHDKLLIMTMSLPRCSNDRFAQLSHTLGTLTPAPSVLHVEAVDGWALEKVDRTTADLLAPRRELLGQDMWGDFRTGDGEEREHWVYDGTAASSFQGLTRAERHNGTKGLTMSNLKCFQIALGLKQFEWLVLLEDDAEFGQEVFTTLLARIAGAPSGVQLALLDGRGGWGGTCAMLYHRSILPTLLNDLHPLSEFSRTGLCADGWIANLWDWKIWRWLQQTPKKENFDFVVWPLVPSGRFESTIDVPEKAICADKECSGGSEMATCCDTTQVVVVVVVVLNLIAVLVGIAIYCMRKYQKA